MTELNKNNTNLNKNLCNDNYFYIDQEENSSKVWTNSYRGSIIKSVYNPQTNKIYQYCIPYNHIDEYKKYLEKDKKKNNNFNSKIVNRNLELTNKFD